MSAHRPGCPALGGYGHGIEPCACGASSARPDVQALAAEAVDVHLEMGRAIGAITVLGRMASRIAAMERALEAADVLRDTYMRSSWGEVMPQTVADYDLARGAT